MSRTKALEKVKLTSFDDLFGGKENEKAAEAGDVREIPLSELHEFHNHPFQVRSDEELAEMIESVREHGVLVPGIVRKRKEGGYEIISGHTRKHVCEVLGLETMPVFVKEMDNDEASVVMVDSNIQREDILPSEKAKAYRMKYDAMKHQGSKEGGLTLGELGEAAGHNWWCVLYPNLCFLDTTNAVLPEKGKQQLKKVLTEEEYSEVTAGSKFQIRWFFWKEK